MKSNCLALFSPLICDAQCCVVKIHFAITSGEQPLPKKNNKSLKVSFSPVGFFQECCCMLVGWVWNEQKTSLLSGKVWIRLQFRSDALWKIIPDAALENLGGMSFLSQCNYDVKFLQLNNLPDVYSDILKYWQNMSSAFQKSTSPLNEIIWKNHKIIIDGKAPFYKSWLEKRHFTD